jgi:hypothetical protein
VGDAGARQRDAQSVDGNERPHSSPQTIGNSVALAEHGVLLFADQSLDDAFVAFLRSFAELDRPALGSAMAHQRSVQAFAPVGCERAVGRPLLSAALGKPRLELTRDAVLAPALMFRRRHLCA